jgi:hypoxanthine phosphoribosyltransferase
MSVTLENAPVRPMLTAEQIQTRIAELGQEISSAYAGQYPVLVCILKGAMPFFVDLSRAVTIPHTWDTLQVSSYHGGMASSGVVKFNADLSDPIEGRHVILVEDIIDTGRTVSYLLQTLSTRRPASIRVATLLDKPSRREVTVPIDFRGFEIPDAFVIGYGLDYGQFYRNLPYVGVLEEVPDLPFPSA